MVNQKMLESFNKLKDDPKVKIYQILKGKRGFNLAQNMLNWDKEKIWDANWASKWSENEKKDALFVLFTQKQRVNEKVGIKLYVGKGNNFAAIGEIHPMKKALKIWDEYIK
jgi:hypothetical protein